MENTSYGRIISQLEKPVVVPFATNLTAQEIASGINEVKKYIRSF